MNHSHWEFFLSDSFVYIAEKEQLPDSSYQLNLKRIPISSQPDFDTANFIFHFQNEHGVAVTQNRFVPASGARFPFNNLLVSYYPLGETTGMIQLGNVSSKGFEPDEDIVDQEGERFYLIDFDGAKPDVIAEVEGVMLDYVYPYLLLYTGYRHGKECPYGCVEITPETRLAVIDFRAMEEIFSVPITDSTWGARLAPDGRLIFSEQDSYEVNFNWSDPSVYITQIMTITEWDIQTGDSITREATIPLYGLHEHGCHWTEPWTGSFLSPDGHARFMQPVGGWGLHGPEVVGRLYRCVPAPGVSDFDSSPYVAEWIDLRRGRYVLLDWDISSGKKWLILGYRSKRDIKHKADTTRVFLAPIEVLTDSSAFHLETFQEFKVPSYSFWSLYFTFTPDEEWVVFNDWRWDNRNAWLFSCDRRGVGRSLLDSTELECGDVYLSPDGRYVAYTCKIADKPGAYLQVRRMPE